MIRHFLYVYLKLINLNNINTRTGSKKFLSYIFWGASFSPRLKLNQRVIFKFYNQGCPTEEERTCFKSAEEKTWKNQHVYGFRVYLNCKLKYKFLISIHKQYMLGISGILSLN